MSIFFHHINYDVPTIIKILSTFTKPHKKFFNRLWDNSSESFVLFNRKSVAWFHLVAPLNAAHKSDENGLSFSDQIQPPLADITTFLPDLFRILPSFRFEWLKPFFERDFLQ